ncbi:alpha/beta fold hydrolase [Streptosporangium sp. OZ121]|uniref:alpha/beta fold hydrolase n=1 Tax=Streptosporangium sp. OZ121 TaxID=3444183 RepID=UPI003F7AC54B
MPDDHEPLAGTERVATRGSRGPVVVFLHGVGCARAQFAAQLAGLDRRLWLLSLDLPGHGESPPLPGGEYGVATVAGAVQADLARRGIDETVLVGHSAGGIAALLIAATCPDLVRGVVVVDSTIALTEPELRANRARSAESNNSDWRRHFMDSMAEAWGTGEHGRAAVFRTLERTPDHVARSLWHNVLAFEPESLWRGVTVPALYLRSRRDTDLRLLQTLNPLISTVDLRPRCGGHWPHVQCPDAVNQALHRFLTLLGLDDG